MKTVAVSVLRGQISMSDFKIEVLKYPTEEDWQWVKLLAMNTMGKSYLMDKDMSISLKKKYLKSEHSPIRVLNFIIKMEIPYCNSVHFVRHKMGVEHFVQSQRNDRQDNYDRHAARQDAPVSHIMYVNAQELMFMARRRLCGKADADTQKIMRMIVKEVLKTNPEFEEVLVPNCQYLHSCPEFQPCGRWKEAPLAANSQLKVPYTPSCLDRLKEYDPTELDEFIDAGNAKKIKYGSMLRQIFLRLGDWVAHDSDVEIINENIQFAGSDVPEKVTQVYITGTCRTNGRSKRCLVAELFTGHNMNTGEYTINLSIPDVKCEPITAELCVEAMQVFLESLPWDSPQKI